MEWKARIRAALETTGRAPDEDVIEELAQHARAMYDAARADGCSQDDADRRVAEQIDQWRREADALRHKSRRAPAVEPPSASSAGAVGLVQDVRYAFRLLRRQPGFALLVVLTMMLGIGATTALFTVTYGVLMKPLPWPDADRIVVLKERRGGRAPRFGSFSNAAYLAWREHAATIDAIAAWSPQTFTMTGIGDPERIRVTLATASLFHVLAVRPLIGLLFDENGESAPVVVLSEGLWRQRFGGDPDVLGRVVHFDGQPHTIVGVAPDALGFPDRQSRAWVPFRVPLATGNLLSMFDAVAKLRPGATIEQAAAEGAARGRFAANTGMTTVAIFGGDGPVEVSVQPLDDALTGEIRRPLTILLGAVVLLLVIATTNIASLQLARAIGRRRELAIRAALGATGARAIRQLLVESLLLGAIGGAAGFIVAWVLSRGAAAILPADFPRVHDLRVDAGVIAFTIVTSVAVSLIVGVLPALYVRRVNLVEALAEDGGASVGANRRSRVAHSRLLIVGGQVAIACVLLVGASLVGRSFLALLHADRGFDPARVLGAAIPMVGPGYTPQRRTAVMAEIVARLSTMPGIRHVAFASEYPATPGGSTSSFTLPSRDGAVGTVTAQASPRLVSPDYFAALGLRIVSGRGLEESDTATSQPVAVVNETFARRYLGDAPLSAATPSMNSLSAATSSINSMYAKIPMGVWGQTRPGDAAIVGVVEDVRYVRASVATLPEMYFSYRQLETGMRSTIATLLLRGDGNPSAFASAIRTVVRQVDGTLVPQTIMTVEDRLLATSLARPRLYATLLASFAAVALAVTGVGLFGVLSYTLAQRRRELGVRAALGARQSDLVALVVRQGMAVVASGVVVGLVASSWLTRFIATLLYGVTPRDWLTYLVVPLVLLIVGAVACFVPARRAASLDPLRALRS
jgi:putative ABC transport system permease protein